MQHARKTLSLRPFDAGDALDPDALLRRAIARRLCVTATYNKAKVRLAPHILYTRHDDLFVDAMVVERDGKPPREVKLGVFKLAGLKDLRLTAASFNPLDGFDGDGPLYAGTTLELVGA